MLEILSNAIATLSCAEAQNLLVEAGDRLLHQFKDSKSWEELFVDTGGFFAGFEKDNTFL